MGEGDSFTGETAKDLASGQLPPHPNPPPPRGEGTGQNPLTPTWPEGPKRQRREAITAIPLAAYDYIVNGKAAIDWVVERQGVKIDKASGIINDANAWAQETMDNPRYPLELLQRVITISLETMEIVNQLPTVF